MDKYYKDGKLVLVKETPWPDIKEYLLSRIERHLKELEEAKTFENVLKIQGKLEAIRTLMKNEPTVYTDTQRNK
jgi:hypothetical protein